MYVRAWARTQACVCVCVCVCVYMRNNEQWVGTNSVGKVTTSWNQQMQTNRTIPNNKLDIIIHDNEEGTCVLIDAAISGNRNVTKELRRT